MKERQGNTRSPLSVFISYAHKDEPLRQQLEAHLSLLRRRGLIADWHDRQIMPGAEWVQEIDEHLETASIILLLISADFVASDYCYDKEMKRALERHKLGEARVIPIILRPCDWHTSPFASLQSLPHDGKAVTTWQNQDEAFLAIAQGLRRVIEQQTPPRPLSHVERENRTRLMKRVQATWIEGVLEHSSHQAALIALDLQEQPDALANPWHLEVQETNLPPRLLPVGTSLVQVYEQADGELLLLGEPGAGKTTLLLELARTLLQRAAKEEHHRIPVVLNLSSWAQERQPLAVWLVEELWTKYQVPRKVGKAWIDADQVLALLDGLDEVAENARPACVQAINAYYQSHLEKGSTPLVICCRSKEYLALATRVTLRRAVSIQPLTQEQIEYYLQSTGSQLEALRHALCNDSELYELARRPLMLSIFTLAYQGAVLEDLPTEGPREAQQQQVFATYVEQMLTRRGVSRLFSCEQALHWLTFLAVQMQQHHQTAFYLERLQPDWLTDWQRRLYQLSIGLVGALVGALAGELSFGLVGALVGGLYLGLVIGLARVSFGEVLTWSWRKTIPGPIIGLVVGLLSWYGGGGLVGGLGLGLVVALSFALIFGLSANQLDEQLRRRPNQGIWHSARNGLVVGLLGLVVALSLGLVTDGVGGSGPVGTLLRGVGGVLGVGGGLFYMLFVVLFFGLGFGLGSFLQHFILRFWLWRAAYFPWNLVAFLDDAADRLLLRKVGGGYIFIHRLLLDYFADLEKKES